MQDCRNVAGHYKRYRATGPELTAWLLPLKGTAGGDMSANKQTSVRQWSCVSAPVSRDGKNHDFFKKIENIEKIENIGYFRYISDFFDIYPIHI